MDVCCSAGAPVVFDYAPKGSLEKIADDLEAYVVDGGRGAPRRTPSIAARRDTRMRMPTTIMKTDGTSAKTETRNCQRLLNRSMAYRSARS